MRFPSIGLVAAREREEQERQLRTKQLLLRRYNQIYSQLDDDLPDIENILQEMVDN